MKSLSSTKKFSSIDKSKFYIIEHTDISGMDKGRSVEQPKYDKLEWGSGVTKHKIVSGPYDTIWDGLTELEKTHKYHQRGIMGSTRRHKTQVGPNWIHV